MEYLSKSLHELKKEPTFQHHPRCRKLDITHISFADDLLLFARGNLSSVTGLYKCFSQFSKASGTNTITRKALVAWDKICTPKSVGGLYLINLPLWNKAAIAKTWWDLAHKQDKLWIRWISAYYIQQQQLQHMPIPQQASWMVRRIIGSRVTMLQAQNSSDHNTSSIRQIYLQLIGELPRVSWKCLVFQNSARPKAVFTMWLLLHGRLPTKDRLANWGINVTPHCVMCSGQVETREHLFVQCSYATELWNKVMKWIQRDQMISSCWDLHL
ncbi:PREDICTED: uncharacterized protein LOC109220273 [Nicotiana attenuata]|uniref:uncharacterized protein LOC109220273 n=1 Tax=Nicotiana attenuata TaxID=49451 RepID=UPI000904FE9E|nr:PREDICTED: uncharacterized protein LOC109220273 [Nicotiana attenuata]